MPVKLLQEHDLVALLEDVPGHNLSAGDIGAIVHCYNSASAYEVEFLDNAGKTKAVVTLEARQILRLNWAPAVAS